MVTDTNTCLLLNGFVLVVTDIDTFITKWIYSPIPSPDFMILYSTPVSLLYTYFFIFSPTILIVHARFRITPMLYWGLKP